jgi:hypothetical protein
MRQIVRLYSLAALLALAASASALDTALGALDTGIIAGSSSIGSQVDPASNASDASNAARTGKGAFKGLAMPSAASKTKQQVLDEIFWENQWKNSLITWMLPDALREVMPHWAQVSFRPKRTEFKQLLCPMNVNLPPIIFGNCDRNTQVLGGSYAVER